MISTYNHSIQQNACLVLGNTVEMDSSLTSNTSSSSPSTEHSYHPFHHHQFHSGHHLLNNHHHSHQSGYLNASMSYDLATNLEYYNYGSSQSLSGSNNNINQLSESSSDLDPLIKKCKTAAYSPNTPSTSPSTSPSVINTNSNDSCGNGELAPKHLADVNSVNGFTNSEVNQRAHICPCYEPGLLFY
jgi:hypothetical protein